MKEIISYSPELQNFLDMWHRATDLNEATAQFKFAKFLLKSKQKSTVKKAFALFKKLANQSYTTVQTDAQYMLAQCYENGYGIQKSYQRAIRWYEKAEKNISEDLIKNPDPVGEAAHKALQEKFNGRDIDETLDEILYGKITPELIDSITNTAESGDVASQKYLMDLYDGGAGYIEDDQEESVYWTQKAAENGDTRAMEKLGERYYYGRGVERDLKTAFYWLKKATAQGCESSVHLLGVHYYSFKNYKEAAKWYRAYALLRIKWRNKRLGWEKERPTKLSKI